MCKRCVNELIKLIIINKKIYWQVCQTIGLIKIIHVFEYFEAVGL